MLTTIWCNILQGLNLVFYHFFSVWHSFWNLCCNFLCVVLWLPTNFIRTQIALAFGVAQALQSWQSNTKNEELIKRQTTTPTIATTNKDSWLTMLAEFKNSISKCNRKKYKTTKRSTNILAFAFSMNKIGNSWNATHGTATGSGSNSKLFRFYYSNNCFEFAVKISQSNVFECQWIRQRVILRFVPKQSQS